jgi:hypothetical protein
MSKKEMKAVKSLRLNQDIRILPADKGNCTVVLDESKYNDKINTLLESGVYEPVHKDPTAKVERKVQQIQNSSSNCSETKTDPISQQASTLIWASQNSQTRHSVETYSEFYRFALLCLAGFLHKILSPLADRSESFVKNSGHFIQLFKLVNLRRQDTLVSFDVVSLFTNVPVDEALQVVRNKLANDNTLAERSILKVEAIMELLDV